MNKTEQAEHADVKTAVVASEARGNPLVRGLGALSELADQPPLITACTAVLAAGLVLRNRRLARAGLRMLLAELVATKAKTIVKNRVDRTRPRAVVAGRDYAAEPGDEHDSEMSSFPSGHTAGAVAVARAFARDYPDHAGTAYAIAAAVGIVQVPRSAHYPSDVTAGAAIGFVSEAAVSLLLKSSLASAGRGTAREASGGGGGPQANASLPPPPTRLRRATSPWRGRMLVTAP